MSRALRAAALVAVALTLSLVGGCEALDPSGSGRPYENICGTTPDRCLVRNCVTSVASPSYADCCDSFYCNCDPETHHWDGYYCDLPPPPELDAGADAGPDAMPDASPGAQPDASPDAS
jgi:hypothetical protein